LSFLRNTLEKFASLIAAQERILAYIAIEEKIDLLLSNFTELQVRIMELTARYSTNWNRSHQEMQIDRNTVVNRSFLNLLSSCRVYLDHTPHHIKQISRISGDDEDGFVSIFRKSLSHQYDNFFGYKVMEAIRNYVQHRAIPFHVSYGMWSLKTEEGHKTAVTVKVFINIDELKADQKFKRGLLPEMERYGKSLDAQRLCAEYVGGIGRAHFVVRNLLEPIIESDMVELSDAIEYFINECEKECGKQEVRAMRIETVDDDISKTKFIGIDTLEYLKTLRKKSPSFENFEDRVLTSEQFRPYDSGWEALKQKHASDST
jgi:hypothetical protein